MSCILRVSGKNFDVDKYLSQCVDIEPINVWYIGEPRFKSRPDGDKSQTSGLSIELSSADFSDLRTQIDEAISFCRTYGEALRLLVGFPGVEHALADFGSEIRDPWWCSYSFPPELMALLGGLGISLGLSIYPVSGDNSDE
jgi:hypothetical protein